MSALCAQRLIEAAHENEIHDSLCLVVTVGLMNHKHP